MTVGVPDKFSKEVFDLLNNHWHSGRVKFTISKIEQLIGKLGRLAQVFSPLYHLMGSLYKSVAHCLCDNEQYIITVCGQFRKMIKQSKHKILLNSTERDVREVRFAARQSARAVHRCR